MRTEKPVVEKFRSFGNADNEEMKEVKEMTNNLSNTRDLYERFDELIVDIVETHRIPPETSSLRHTYKL